MRTWTVSGRIGGWAVPGYTEERQLGSGATGRVVAAADKATGQRVAIKYLSPALLGDPVFTWRFRAEAGLQRSLDVPQIVRVFGYVEEPGRGAAIVMELVDGVSLHEMIVRRGPTSPEAALAVLKGSLLGVAAAHAAGIVHRDFKPENVLVNAEGSSKLADFGVAVKAGKQQPSAGTPLYMAPEQWNGAPSSPATDIYAATAVFFECLTGKAPFNGRGAELRQQHETAAVPVDGIALPSLRALIARGMAKDPADRPQGAIAFVSELELAAAATCGADWEQRARIQLAVRVAALLPLLLAGGGAAGSSGTSLALSRLGGHHVTRAVRKVTRAGHKDSAARRKALTAASVAAAAVIVVIAGTAVALTGKHSPPPSLAGNASVASTTLPAVTAAVLPPVAASHCAAPASFRAQGTITATAPGPVSYQWVYSSGQRGPVRTIDFTAPGRQAVTGDTVKTRTAGTGWAEIKTISPAATSNKASYRLLCTDGDAGVSATAVVTPASAAVTCGAPAPEFTATGSITSSKAQTVSYYWSLSDGRTSAPATLTFTRPGTLPAQAFAVTPQDDPSSGEAVLAVSSPAAVSAPAPYALSCTVPRHLAASATVSPASTKLGSCTAAAPALTFSGTVSDHQAGTVSYYWKLPSGSGPARTLTFAKAGSQTVTTTYKPVSDSASGSGSLVVTSPASVTSNAAAFTVACGATLTVSSDAPAAATVGAAYSGTVTVTGGKGTYAWGTVSGLPAGLTASASGATLTISGTPAKAGSFTIPLSVHDSGTPQGSGTASLALTVGAAALKIASDAPPAATTGTAYAGTLTVSGGNGTYAWGTVSGLPAGLTASASGATLTISGTPATVTEGAATATVTVSDTEATPQTATATVKITVGGPALVISTTALPSGASGDDYSAAVTATGGTGAYTWSATGLPRGLAIAAATGTISGTLGELEAETVDKPGPYTVTVTVRDASTSAQKQLTLVVTPEKLYPGGGFLETGVSGTAYSDTVSASGGTPAYRYSATGLPAGLTMSATGTISGTAPVVTAATTYSVTVTVTDSGSPAQSASATYSLPVNPAPAGPGL